MYKMEAKGARFKKYSKITIQILNGLKSSVSDPGSFVRIRMGLYSQARIRIRMGLYSQARIRIGEKTRIHLDPKHC